MKNNQSSIEKRIIEIVKEDPNIRLYDISKKVYYPLIKLSKLIENNSKLKKEIDDIKKENKKKISEAESIDNEIIKILRENDLSINSQYLKSKIIDENISSNHNLSILDIENHIKKIKSSGKFDEIIKEKIDKVYANKKDNEILSSKYIARSIPNRPLSIRELSEFLNKHNYSYFPNNIGSISIEILKNNPQIINKKQLVDYFLKNYKVLGLFLNYNYIYRKIVASDKIGSEKLNELKYLLNKNKMKKKQPSESIKLSEPKKQSIEPIKEIPKLNMLKYIPVDTELERYVQKV